LASASGLPCSAVISTARSSTLASIRSCQRRRIVERSLAVFAAQAGKAAAAASMARRVSAAPRLGTVPITSPVAGFVTSTVPRASASIHAPST
jgi:hypothetical protein